jgi:hypothetical protein
LRNCVQYFKYPLLFIYIFGFTTYFQLYPDTQSKKQATDSINFNHITIFICACCVILIIETILDISLNVTVTFHHTKITLFARLIVLLGIIFTIITTHIICSTESYISILSDSNHIRHNLIMSLTIISSTNHILQSERLHIWVYASLISSIVTFIQIIIYIIHLQNNCSTSLITINSICSNIISPIIVTYITYYYYIITSMSFKTIQKHHISSLSFHDSYNKAIFISFIFMEILRSVFIIFINYYSVIVSSSMTYETTNSIYMIIDIIVTIMLVAAPDRYGRYKSKMIPIYNMNNMIS